MRPDNPNIIGTVIDHHLDHPSFDKRKYKLIWDNVPASLIVWREFKDEIPQREWWKTVIGVVGDGQPNTIPFEIWNTSPELLMEIKTFGRMSYGKWQFSLHPVYSLLSSPINAFARFGDFETPLRIIKNAKSPFDIVENREAKSKKKELSDTFDSVFSNSRMYNFKNLTVVIFNSPKARLSGYIASSILSSSKGTVMAINEENGRLSVRGDLTNYYQGKLKDLDYISFSGHDGFMGGRLTDSPDRLLKDLMKIL